MRLKRLWVGISLFVLCGSSTLLAQNNGSLKLRVGVIFKLGDVRPVARTDFYLLPKSFESISVEAAVKAGIKLNQPFEEYMDQLSAVSPQLRDWMKARHRMFLSPYDITADDVLEIPELLAIAKREGDQGWLSLVPKYPKSEKDSRKDAENKRKYKERLQRSLRDNSFGLSIPSDWIKRATEEINKLHPEIKYHESMLGRLEQSHSLGAAEVPTRAVQYVKTSLDGFAELKDVPAGTYWISNGLPWKLGESSILWDFKVAIQPNVTTEIELSNDNAAKID